MTVSSILTVVTVAFLGAANVQPGAAVPEKQTTTPAKPVEKSTNSATTPMAREDGGWKKRHESFNARAAQGHEKGDIGVLFIGDSITQGWEGAGKQAWEDHFSRLGAANLGIGGDRTQHVIWRMQNGNLDGLDNPKPAGAKPPRVAVVMIGTNNMGDNTPEEIAAGVAGVVGSIHAKLPGAKVLLLAILPRSEKPDALREKVAATNRLIAPLADGKSVHFLDSGGGLVQDDGTIRKEIMPDFLHLSPRGYELWAGAIAPKLTELMGD